MNAGNTAQNRKYLLDPCHSKCINVSKLQLSRMKLKMRLELRALKKITDEVVHEDDSYVVVVPANVYENPLDTVLSQSHEGINGCYGTATEDQLKTFFGANIPYKTATTGVKEPEISAHGETESADELSSTLQEPLETVAELSPTKSLKEASVAVDDVELQNAIWNITTDLSLEHTTAPTDQMSFDDFLMDHDNSSVLFDLS